MLNKINDLVEKVQQFHADSAESIEQFRLKFLSKKGEISQLFDEFRNVPADMKKQVGVEINKLKSCFLWKLPIGWWALGVKATLVCLKHIDIQ